MELLLFILVISAAILFEYINGFHDTANSIATVVSTRVLSPKKAVIYGATLNFIGALSGTHVAATIGKGIVDAGSVSQCVILSALICAIVWNLITWYWGLPSSSSHALIGGLLGASIANAGLSVVNLKGLLEKVIFPMILSPVIGLIIGFLFMLALLWLFHRSNICKANLWFKKLQLISSGVMAFSHGSNDAQKTMGIITLAAVSFYKLKDFEVNIIVIVVCAATMAFGTLAGGWKIIKTMGSKVIKLKPIHGFAAETASAGVILTASHFGIPVSTTHVISSSIMGVGTTQRLSAVNWKIIGNIVIAWTSTIPFCMILSGIIFSLGKIIFN